MTILDIRERFNRVTSRDDLDALRESSGSDDGELSWFECKGVKDGSSLTKDDKKRVAKELCALTNTYGGIVCLHRVGSDELVPFDQNVSALFGSVESWLSTCLEPPVTGMDLKEVDGLLRIFIPESKVKPHRSVHDGVHYHRSSTQSPKMPESMVRALYRGGDVLDFVPGSNMQRIGGEGLLISLSAYNRSRVCGTSPRFHFALYSHIPNVMFDLKGKKEMDGSGKGPSLLDLCGPESMLYLCDNKTSTPKLREELLYPHDSIVINLRGGFKTLKDYKVFLLEYGITFAETGMVSRWVVYEVPKNDTGPYTVLCDVPRDELTTALIEYEEKVISL